MNFPLVLLFLQARIPTTNNSKLAVVCLQQTLSAVTQYSPHTAECFRAWIRDAFRGLYDCECMLFSFSWWMQKLKPMVLKSKSYTLMKKKSYSEASCELEVTKCLFECLIYILVFRNMVIIT